MIQNGDFEFTDIKISFRTQDMDKPKLAYQRSADYPGEVALMAQFLPCFTKSCSSKVTTSGLEERDLNSAVDFKYQFIFVVDRSGSMGCSNRMHIANEALKLFMKSLPSGSKFGILSFGSRTEWMNLNGTQKVINYNDLSRNNAIA